MNRADNSEILSHVDGSVGHLWLNRPQALHALSRGMIADLTATLQTWRHDSSVKSVIIESTGEKAFSAGADVRSMWAHATAGEAGEIRRYFADEFALDLLVSEYPKPVAAIVDGICFGGGMALAVHSHVRVVTEAASFSMPETLIGYFPDAGATWFLPRLPGFIGTFLGLTGTRITGADAVHLGLADHYVERRNLEQAKNTLENGRLREIAQYASPLSDFSLASHRAEIDACFSAGSVPEIVGGLKSLGSPWAEATLATLARQSPAALEWTLAILRANTGRDLAQCLAAELELVERATAHPDFAEGVRAALIDKDKTPRWAHG